MNACHRLGNTDAARFAVKVFAKYPKLPRMHPVFFGIRNELREKGNKARFNDIVGLITFSEGGHPAVRMTTGTCDPGLPWILKPFVPAGAAILVPGLHYNIWRLGTRKKVGRYKNVKIMRQDGSIVTIYRDKNKTGKIELNKDVKQKGNFEIQFHPMYGQFVGRYGAGCQGPNNKGAYDEIIECIEDYDESTGVHNRYSYVLLGRVGDVSLYPSSILTPLYDAGIESPYRGLKTPTGVA